MAEKIKVKCKRKGCKKVNMKDKDAHTFKCSCGYTTHYWVGPPPRVTQK